MDRSIFEKFGTVGVVVAAAACPICFPKIALVGAAVGFGIFAPFESYIAVGVQVLFALAFVGQVLAFPRHRNRWLLTFSAATTALLFAGYYQFPSSILLQVSLAGLVAASIWLAVESRRCAKCEAQARVAKADA